MKKLLRILVLAALSVWAAACGKQATTPDNPEGNDPSAPADTTIHLRYDVPDTLVFDAGQTISLKADWYGIQSLKISTLLSGWTVVQTADFGLDITAPAKGGNGSASGYVSIKVIDTNCDFFYIKLRVAIGDVRSLAHPAAGFMGDSITYLWNVNGSGHPKFFSSNNFSCFGISGDTTADMKRRFDKLIEVHPDILVLLAGTNDIAQNDGYYVSDDKLLANLAEMADRAKADGMKIILCSILPANKYYWNTSIKPAERIRDLNPKIKQMVTDKGYDAYCDYYTEMVDDQLGLPSKYSSDGVHPTYAGFLKMEEILLPIIQGLQE